MISLQFFGGVVDGGTITTEDLDTAHKTIAINTKVADGGERTRKNVYELELVEMAGVVDIGYRFKRVLDWQKPRGGGLVKKKPS